MAKFLVINSNLFSPASHKICLMCGVLGLSFGLGSAVAFAGSADYVALVDPVAQQQPDALMAEGLQSLSKANQSLSQSWLSDAVAITVAHENDALTGNLDTQNWAVGAEFSILLPKQRRGLQGVSDAYRTQLSVQQDYLKWLASGKLRQLAWAYKKAQIEKNLAESALKNAFEMQENVQRKVEVGDSAQLDLLLAEKFVLEQQAFVQQKQGQLSLLQKEFKFWTNQSDLPKDIVEIRQPSWPLSKHPKLRWVQSAYEVSKAQYSQQKTLNQGGPTFSIGAQNEKNNTEGNTLLFVEVSVPIGSAPMNQVSVAEKQQAIQEQSVAVKRTKQALHIAILSAEQDVLMREQSRLLAKQQHKISQETLRLAEQAYQLGESSIQSLLLIKKEAILAQLNMDLASANFEQAIAQVNQVKGHSLTNVSHAVLERGQE
ncbi:MAG: outer membrane protein, heavy metal efflux system [Thiomicrorhabdus sp.]|nr:MAG: outer membrane protein, heavy metal efflux system [Thiomicrorhabdus sp.]